MKIIIALLLLLSSRVFASPVQLHVDSELLKHPVLVQVALPETYHHSDHFHYPLLVVLDGSTQFEHVAGNVRFLSTYAIIPEMIVVGVAAHDRLKYFTPTEIGDAVGRSGAAAVYADFLQRELLPAMSKQYRVAPYRIIFGHSLSGLFTSYLALRQPLLFNAAISISPSLWWDDFNLVNRFDELTKEPAKTPVRWFLSLASEPDEMAEGFANMVAKLQQQKPDYLTWWHQRFPDETHDSTPLIGNVQALQTIFAGWNAVPEIDVKKLSDLEKHYQQQALLFGYGFPMAVHQYNVYGLKAAYEGQPGWGVAILEKGTQIFAASEILWDSLATVYNMNQQLENAQVASEKAVQLAQKHESIYLQEILHQNRQLKQAQADTAEQ